MVGLILRFPEAFLGVPDSAHAFQSMVSPLHLSVWGDTTFIIGVIFGSHLPHHLFISLLVQNLEMLLGMSR